MNANPPNYSGAYQAFKDIIENDKIFPDQHPEIYYYAGLAAEYSGDIAAFKDAKKYLQGYVNRPNPDPKMLISAKGQLDMIDGQEALNGHHYQEALSAFQKAGVDDPSLSPGLQSTIQQIKGQIDVEHADQAQQQGDLVSMIHWYEQAERDCPEMASQLDPVIAQLKDEQEENETIDRSMNQAQNESDPQVANQILERIYAQYPDAHENVPLIAVMIASNQANEVMSPPNGAQGDPVEAMQILENMIQEHPNTVNEQCPYLYYTMAQYAMQSGHLEQAKRFFSEFEPFISQYTGNASFMGQIAYMNQQLNGSNAKLSNWANYMADWLGQKTGIHANWWLNNVINSAQGVLLNTDGMDHLNAGARFGKHPLFYHKHVQGMGDEKATVQERLNHIRSALVNVSDPEERARLQLEQSSLENEIHQIEQSRNGQWRSERSPDAAKQEKRSQAGFFRDIKTTIQNREDEGVKNDRGDVIAKGEGALDDPSAPGFWGLGTTLQQAQASYQNLGMVDAVLSDSKSNEGLRDYTMTASGGTHVLNAEERLFNMCYGGPTAAGLGVHWMDGAQARADLVDEEYGLNYAGGDTSLGGQTFSIDNGNALATGGANESAVIGTQADAHGGFSVGSRGIAVGANTGAFGGAQASGQVQANLLGQGGFVMGQAWAGLGAKANCDISLGADTHFSFGIGAALGIGGYLQVSGNINFEAMGQDLAAIYGDDHHSLSGMLSRATEMAGSVTAAGGAMVEHAAGDVHDLLGDAQNYLGARAVNDVFHAQNAGQFFQGVGEGAGELATDAADLVPAVAVGVNAAKQIGQMASQVGEDIAHGEIGDAIQDTVEDTAKGAWNIVKDTAVTAWNAVKRLFSWL
ncbi:MAG: tetratricopeptide repeat protein [Myxococcaceae bacterium]|nr:tetratricopeptide repeat protein [Myxococcaceae bacterium]MBH2006544.1 tetratricopeptide repeat protein [Myxococcaceae bacterium]